MDRPIPKQEPFSITKGDSDVTSQDGLNASNEYGMIWEYHVPVGLGLIILAGHTFSLYLHGDDNAEMPDTTMVKVVVLDASKQDEKTILGPVMYKTLKEFQDRDKVARFSCPEPVKVYENQYLQVQTAGADATGTGGVDQTGGSSDSYFEAAISRVRQPL
jgi:hypothetical protein